MEKKMCGKLTINDLPNELLTITLAELTNHELKTCRVSRLFERLIIELLVSRAAYGVKEYARDWNLKAIGPIPPISLSHLRAILLSPCPIEKKIRILFTHLLILIPKEVSVINSSKITAQPFTLGFADKHLASLIQSELDPSISNFIPRNCIIQVSVSKGFDSFSQFLPQVRIIRQPATETHWALVYLKGIPRTEQTSYDDAIEYCKKLGNSTCCPNYTLPSARDLIISTFARYIQSGFKTVCFRDEFVLCSDRNGDANDCLSVGEFRPDIVLDGLYNEGSHSHGGGIYLNWVPFNYRMTVMHQFGETVFDADGEAASTVPCATASGFPCEEDSVIPMEESSSG